MKQGDTQSSIAFYLMSFTDWTRIFILVQIIIYFHLVSVLLHFVLYYFLKYHLVVHVVITLKLVIVHNRYYGNQYKRHLAVLTLETGSSVSDGLSVE